MGEKKVLHWDFAFRFGIYIFQQRSDPKHVQEPELGDIDKVIYHDMDYVISR